MTLYPKSDMQSNSFLNDKVTPMFNQIPSQVTTIPKTTNFKQNVWFFFNIQLVTVLTNLWHSDMGNRSYSLVVQHVSSMNFGLS